MTPAPKWAVSLGGTFSTAITKRQTVVRNAAATSTSPQTSEQAMRVTRNLSVRGELLVSRNERIWRFRLSARCGCRKDALRIQVKETHEVTLRFLIAIALFSAAGLAAAADVGRVIWRRGHVAVRNTRR